MGCTISQTAMQDTKQFMIKNDSLWINCSFHIYLILFFIALSYIYTAHFLSCKAKLIPYAVLNSNLLHFRILIISFTFTFILLKLYLF